MLKIVWEPWLVCTGKEFKPSCKSLSSYTDIRSARRNITDSIEFLCVSKIYDTNSAIEASLVLLSSSCLIATLSLSLLYSATKQAGWYLNSCAITSPAFNFARNCLGELQHNLATFDKVS